MDNVPVRMNEIGRKNHTNTSDGSRHRPKKRGVRFAITSIVAVVLLAAVVAGGLFVVKSTFGSAIESGKYQAVFLTSGQVYFGKLKNASGEYLNLTDVFYIQASTDTEENIQNAGNDDESSDLQLVKLGNEIHGPEDKMLINKDQVLFFENLKTDGKISETIKQYYDNLD